MTFTPPHMRLVFGLGSAIFGVYQMNQLQKAAAAQNQGPAAFSGNDSDDDSLINEGNDL